MNCKQLRQRAKEYRQMIAELERQLRERDDDELRLDIRDLNSWIAILIGPADGDLPTHKRTRRRAGNQKG